MTKPTEGPWRAELARTLVHILGQSPVCSISVTGYKGMSAIERNEFRERALADARLIAAAPDLLAALVLIAGHGGKTLIGDGRYDEGAARAFDQMADIARAAIA